MKLKCSYVTGKWNFAVNKCSVANNNDFSFPKIEWLGNMASYRFYSLMFRDFEC